MQTLSKRVTFCLALLIPSQTLAADFDVSQVVKHAGVAPDSATLVVRRTSDGQVWNSNAARAKAPFVPASTSKIPHTLIALETGIATADTVFDWDGKTRFVPAWNQDQTLQTAYHRSAVWVYQNIAQAVGHARMVLWMAALDYGNHTIGDAEQLTTYWLDGPLKISADQQVDFLTRLASGQLALSPETLTEGKAIMRAKDGPGWTLYAKTGWGLRGDDPDIGWYVGWVERDAPSAEQYVFAFNLDMQAREDRHKRQTTVLHVLVAIGALPQDVLHTTHKGG